jgi:hypothetical protein
MDKLIFVQDIQKDPETGELKQSTSSPDSINGKIFRCTVQPLQHLPFFRWFFKSPVVLQPSDRPAARNDKTRK